MNVEFRSESATVEISIIGLKNLQHGRQLERNKRARSETNPLVVPAKFSLGACR